MKQTAFPKLFDMNDKQNSDLAGEALRDDRMGKNSIRFYI